MPNIVAASDCVTSSLRSDIHEHRDTGQQGLRSSKSKLTVMPQQAGKHNERDCLEQRDNETRCHLVFSAQYAAMNSFAAGRGSYPIIK